MATYLDALKKQEIFGQYGTSNKDTGSAESQIALFSVGLHVFGKMGDTVRK